MLEKFFSFSGRLNRKPFWLRTLALYAIVIGFAVLFFVLGSAGGSSDGVGALEGLLEGAGLVVAILAGIAFIAFFISSLSLSVRRLHDRNKSGWWLLFFLFVPNIIQYVFALSGDPTIALVGAVISFAISIWYLVEVGFLRGTDGPNRYGDDPLGGASADVFD